MFHIVVHVPMPFCACGDAATLVTGVSHSWNNTCHFVECTRCSHQEKSRVEQVGVTIVRVPSDPPNFRD